MFFFSTPITCQVRWITEELLITENYQSYELQEGFQKRLINRGNSANLSLHGLFSSAKGSAALLRTSILLAKFQLSLYYEF